jgi:hypothetical protein
MLAEHKRPVRECELWREGNEDPLFRKSDGAVFWKEDMACLLTKMVESELVTRIYLPQHVVFVAITQKGYERLLKKERPKELMRLKGESVKRLVSRILRYYSNEETPDLEDKLVGIVKELPKEYAEGVLARSIGAYKGMFDFNVSKFGLDTWAADRLREITALCTKLELGSEVIAKIDEAGNKRFTELHAKEIGRAATIVRKSLGNCIFCKAEIHNEDAAKDEELLKKFAGTKTGIVCCSCFSHLEWAQKHLVEAR